jgi:hypothetical protein
MAPRIFLIAIAGTIGSCSWILSTIGNGSIEKMNNPVGTREKTELDRQISVRVLSEERVCLQNVEPKEFGGGAPGETRTPDPLLRSRSNYFAKSCQRSG